MTKSILIYITDEIKTKLQKLAKEKQLPLTALIRLILIKEIEK